MENNKIAAKQENNQAMTQNKKKTLDCYLMENKEKIISVIPKQISSERMVRVIMNEIRRTPALQDCTPVSFLSSTMQCCQLGLEPGVLGQAYLIPYGNECQFMLGYKGMIELAMRSGDIVSIQPLSVHENDEFVMKYGLNPVCDLTPNRKERGQFEGICTIIMFKNGTSRHEYMSAEEINKIRDTSRNYASWIKRGRSGSKPIWEEHYIEMCKKTAIRRMFKYLPVSIELQEALYNEESTDDNKYHNTFDGVVYEEETIKTTKSRSDDLAKKIDLQTRKNDIAEVPELYHKTF